MQLLRSSDATFESPGALKVVVRDIDEDAPEIFGPFAIESDTRTRLSADLVPGSEFLVDVSACISVDDCTEATRLARGCSDVERVTNSDPFSLTISLSDPDSDVARACPPAF
ncbi:MAG: hypothetical protein GY822_30170 [Deltaproteobacteria bacterium]|nr:hypothetical protein [Deltaproteobacteria bacterium]